MSFHFFVLKCLLKKRICKEKGYFRPSFILNILLTETSYRNVLHVYEVNESTQIQFSSTLRNTSELRSRVCGSISAAGNDTVTISISFIRQASKAA